MFFADHASNESVALAAIQVGFMDFPQRVVACGWLELSSPACRLFISRSDGVPAVAGR